MRHYETMYIVDADTPDETVDAIIEKYKKVVTDGGGEVSEAGRWEKGRRKLAYTIAKKARRILCPDAIYGGKSGS